MSRFDPPAEKDPNAYDDKPHDTQDDLDVPDFDVQEVVVTYDPAAIERIELWKYRAEHAVSVDPILPHDVVLNKATHHELLHDAIDPAEHAAHALIDALTTLEQQIALCGDKDLERARQLYAMVFRHEKHVAVVTDKASAKVDEIMERRR